MAEAYLTDNSFHKQDVPYPFDWEVISDYGIKPQLTITLSPEETRELMVAAESSVRHKYSNGGKAYATLCFDYSTYLYKSTRVQPESMYYQTSLDAFVFDIKPDQGISSEDYYETAPNEWVSFTYTKSNYQDYYYWKRTSNAS